MTAIPFTDTHVHLWDPGRLRYAWLDGLPALNRPFLPGDYRAASATLNVTKLIFVEAACDPSQSLAEVEWVTELARTEPRLRGIVAQVPVEQGDAVRAALRTLATNPLVKGVRRILQGETDPEFCRRPNVLAGVQALAEFDFSFDLCLGHSQLPAALELVKRCPAVRFVLDHAGKPPIRDQALEPWRRHLRALADQPNVCCKLSGLVTEADPQRWQPAHLAPYIAHVLACFGYDRVLLGSDWPVVTLAADCPRWIGALRQVLAGANAVDLARLFHANAERIYRV